MCEDLKRLEPVKNADVFFFFFFELTSKQKGRAVVLLTSEERIIVKETLSVQNDRFNCFKTNGYLWKPLRDFSV